MGQILILQSLDSLILDSPALNLLSSASLALNPLCLDSWLPRKILRVVLLLRLWNPCHAVLPLIFPQP